ncbi:MAG: hypothetical protein E6H06_15275 [Bacteroidetes bacterium]|nr:MAG: hypothetical protein E6H06_15275 [Bacteroidota bacterium]
MQNSTTYITTVFSKLDIPEMLLEKLAGNRAEMKTSEVVIPNILETIDHSSTETYTTVNVEVIFMSDDFEDFGYIHVPVITPFLFTCTKGSKDEFDVDWATSLS